VSVIQRTAASDQKEYVDGEQQLGIAKRSSYMNSLVSPVLRDEEGEEAGGTMERSGRRAPTPVLLALGWTLFTDRILSRELAGSRCTH
jgi:hypothetical protein